MSDKPNRRQRFSDWLSIRFSTSTHMDGLWVGVCYACDGHTQKDVLRKVCEAINLIKIHDPYRYRMILKELDRVLVDLIPVGRAIFRADKGWCVIDSRCVCASTPESIASTIAHEATHGRLIRRNIGYGEEIRFRVEIICVRQQLACAKKLPNADDLVQQLEEWLEATPNHWTNAAFTTRRLEGERELARYLGLPEWFTRALISVRDRMADRRAQRAGSPHR